MAYRAAIAALVAMWVFEGPLVAAVAVADGFYVWQRQWSDKVVAAVDSELAAGTHDVHVLGGELELGSGEVRWLGAEVPERIWRHSRVTAVFRLPVQSLDDPGKSAMSVVARARALGVHRIQLDVDVPERKIFRYAELVEGVRNRWSTEAGNLHLGSTFLPCHLGLNGIRRVLAAVDEPVIQLHGIDAPKSRNEPWSLMKRETVFRALRTARNLDGRFKMALPSYAYVLTFNADGGFRRLYAEGGYDELDVPPGTTSELAAPDLDLLGEVFRSPWRLPVIWFRLPVRGMDRWCLERETLVRLERGEQPKPKIEFSVRGGGRAGTVDLVACYRHQISLKGAVVEIDWGACGMDGEFFPLNGCEVPGNTVHGRLPDSVRLAPFAGGEPFVFGKAIAQVDPRRISVKETEVKK